jgi:F-type H+-transporting ATPase subunit b
MSTSVDMSPLIEGAILPAQNTVMPLIAAVTVDFDKSVFIQMALFALLIVVLKPLLLDPMLRVFTLREERTDGAKADARAMQERAAEILSNYEAQVARVRAEATAERDALRKETSKLEAEILAEAQEAAAAITREGRAKIEVEVAALSRDLDARAESLVHQIGGRVLGRDLS